MGKPQEDIIDDYDPHEVDGMTVWVHVDVQTEDEGMVIRYSKFLFNESILVRGIAY